MASPAADNRPTATDPDLTRQRCPQPSSSLSAVTSSVPRFRSARRIATGLVLAAILVPALFLLPSGGVLALALVVTQVAMWEAIGMLRRLAPGAPYAALLFAFPPLAVALVLMPGLQMAPTAGTVLFALLVGSFLLVLGGQVSSELAPGAVALCLVTLVYLSLPVYSAYHLHRRDPWLLFLVVVIVVVGDSLAYYVGSAIGRRKLAPRVSPNKSWEGAAASFTGALVCAAVFGWWRFDVFPSSLVLLAALVAIAAQLGDLYESLLKRAAGVKDSGSLLPGHGGALDRLDAFLFALPTFHFGSLWLLPQGPGL